MERSREDVEMDGAGDGGGAEVLREIGRLKQRHTEIEKRLSELDRHLSLTSDEQIERARLKKEKLWSKDRITLLGQQVQAA